MASAEKASAGFVSVGQALQKQREASGRSIDDVAAELCLMPSYVRAIEKDDLASLPGAFFYKSFVRQYAALLELNPADLADGVSSLIAAHEPASEHATPAPKPIRMPDPIVEAANKLDFSSRRLAVPAIALMVAVLGGAAFFEWWKRPAAEAPVATVPASPSTGNIVLTSQQSATANVADAPAVNVKTTTDENGVRRMELSISASETTWLSVTSDGKQIFSGVLHPEETKILSGLDGAQMRVGNAGGLNVQVNGKGIGPLGAKGQVRVLKLTPDGAQFLTPETDAL